jgi:hypothetical protein
VLRRRPSPAFVLALVALLVALGGSAPAAPVREAAKKLVTGKQIKDSSLTGKDVKDRSLTPKDFKGSVRGPKGSTGATGATGATGLQGVSGVTKVTRLDVVTSSVAMPDINYQLLRDVGNITKSSATSRVKLTWNGRNQGTGSGAWFCDYQLRIDGAAPPGAGGRAVVQPVGAATSGLEPAGATAFFDGLAAGTHSVDIYVRGSTGLTTNCSTAVGGFADEIFVEEMPV